jgi:predicted AAA+ superfamily ATPase
MPYTDFLTPRPEVLSEDGIEGIIDLANLDDPKKRKLEARPAAFLGVTYPTADVRRVLDTLHRRFSGDADAPGLFLFEGLKGSGKSHLLLLMYHLFNSPNAAEPWLRAKGRGRD